MEQKVPLNLILCWVIYESKWFCNGISCAKCECHCNSVTRFLKFYHGLITKILTLIWCHHLTSSRFHVVDWKKKFWLHKVQTTLARRKNTFYLWRSFIFVRLAYHFWRKYKLKTFMVKIFSVIYERRAFS